MLLLALTLAARGADPVLVLQDGHQGRVADFAYGPDGRWLCTVGGDGRLIQWHTPSRKALRVTEVGTNLNAVAVSPDGALVVTGGGDAENRDFALHLYDGTTGEALGTVPAHGLWVRDLAFTPDGGTLLSYGADGKLLACAVAGQRIGDCRPLAQVKGWGGHLAVRDDGGAVAITDEQTLHVLTLPDGERAFKKKLKPEFVFAIDWAEDIVLVAAEENAVKGWSMRGKVVRQLTDLPVNASTVAWFEGFAVVGDQSGNLIFWDALRGEAEPVLLDTFDGPVDQVALAPDLESATVAFAEGGGLGQAHLQRLDMYGGATRSYGAYLRGIEAALPFDGGRRVAVAMDRFDSTWFPAGAPVAIVDLGTGRVERVLRGLDAIDHAAVSSDGRRLAAVGADRLIVWELDSGRAIADLPVAKGADVVAIAPDGSRVAVGGARTGEVQLVDVAAGAVARAWTAHDNAVGALAFSPDGRTLATGGYRIDRFVLDVRLDPKDADWRVRLWDAETGEPGPVMTGHGESIVDLEWSPDGARLAAADRAGETRVWSADGTLVDVVAGPSWWLSDAAWSADGATLAVASHQSREVVLWDAATKASRRVTSPTGVVRRVAFSDRHLVTGGSAQLEVWDADPGEAPVATLVLPEDDDLLVVTDDAYLATRGALDAVAWRADGQVYAFEQFDLWRNRPHDVLARLGFAEPALIEGFADLYRRRVARSGLDVAEASYQPPAIELVGEVPRGSYEPEVTLRVRASDPTVGVDRVMVYARGVPVHGSHGVPIAAGPGEVVEQEVRLRLAPGSNPIEVSAVNAAGAESLRTAFEIEYAADADAEWARTAWVFAVGVGDYAQDGLDLRYAAKDAGDVASFFGAGAPPWDHVRTEVITDAAATREGILALREKLLSTSEDDLVVLFLAGHGLLDADDRYWFGTHDVDPADPAARGLAYEEIEGLLDGIPARRRLLLMDTCHAGEVDPADAAADLPEGVAARAVGVDARGTRVVQGASRRLDVGGEVMRNWFAELRRSSGTTVIAAAGGLEYALESGEWNNGVFTWALLSGLRDRTADLDRSGAITTAELLEHVAARVSEATSGRQIPTARRENLSAFVIVSD